MKRFLVIRPDRLGDVLLSTPTFAALKARFPDSRITALVRANVEPLLAGLPELDEVLTYDPDGRHQGWKGWLLLRHELRSRGFDCAVTLQSQRRVAAAVFAAGIPLRIGPRSKVHSYAYYNRGIRQHRSRVEMHEADYNLALLGPLGISVAPRSVPTRIHLNEAARNAAEGWLKAQGWNPSMPLVAVHPGMGGSALNWPEDSYRELIRELLEQGVQVLVTAGMTEQGLLDQIRGALGGSRPSGDGSTRGALICYGGRESRGLDFLAGLFSFCRVVVAPSTGPLHLAVASGRPVVSFFPPIRVQSAKRWGPYVQDPGQATVLVPELSCEETFACNRLCKSYPCMRNIPVRAALDAVRQRLL